MEQLITEGEAQEQLHNQELTDKQDQALSLPKKIEPVVQSSGSTSRLEIRDTAQQIAPSSGLGSNKVSQSVALDPGALSQGLEDENQRKLQVGASEFMDQPSHRDSLAFGGPVAGASSTELRAKELLIQNMDAGSQGDQEPPGVKSYAMLESQVRLSQDLSEDGQSKRYGGQSQMAEHEEERVDGGNHLQASTCHDVLGSVVDEPMKSAIPDDASSIQPGKAKRLKPYLVVLDKSKMLPPQLPEGLVYWNRCKALLQPEAIERSGHSISNDMLESFYATDFRHHEDLDGDVAKVSDRAPFFRGKPIWVDLHMKPRFVNRAEERILKENVWPEGLRKYHIEGHIMLSKCTDRTVFFNSQFETGNLRQVFIHDPKKMLRAESFKPSTPQNPELLRTVDPARVSSYDLYLQDDTNSDNSLTQWFYFSCMNVKKGTVIKLNMLNLMKDDSLYSQGMQPFVYSRRRHLEGDGVKWHREGFNIEYYYNDLTTRTSGKTLDMAFDPRYVENMKDKFKKTSTLSFSYEFQYDYDTVFFAHFAPYSYSDVFRYLCKLEGNEELRKIMRIDHICNSLAKIPMYGLTITNNLETEYISQAQEIELYRQYEYNGLDVRPKKKKIRLPGLPGYVDPATAKKTLAEIAHEKMTIPSRQVEEKKEKKPAAAAAQLNRADWLGTIAQQVAGPPAPVQPTIEEEIRYPKYKKFLYLTSRVHPGETNSQYMIQGCIEFLLSDDPVAVQLRTNFVIKVIPILNPDGVIHGNYRASLMGVDLNRRWKNPSRYLHPTIYHTKSLMKFHNDLGAQFDSDSGGVVFSCDMHGHSRNMNIFMYACRNFSEDPLVARVPNQVIWSIPENVHHFCPIFSHKECKMAVEKDKEATARIVLFKELGLLNSYTLEATFHGSEYFKKPRNNWIRQLAPEDAEKINEKYEISDTREDIHITPSDLLYVGHDFCRGIHHASLRKPASYHWFDNPKKTEEIRLKEAAIIAAQEKELEEIKAKEREAARIAKAAEKERIKAQKAAEKQQMIQEARLAKMRERGIDPETAPPHIIEKIDEEVQAELKRQRIKKRKARKEKEFSAWDEEAKQAAQQKKKKRKEHKVKKPTADGKVMAAAFGRSIYGATSSKYPGQAYTHLEGQPILIGDGEEHSPYLSYQLMSKSRDPNAVGQIGMGLGDQLMMQYNKYTQNLQRPLPNRIVLGGVGLAQNGASPVHPGLLVSNSKQPGVGLYGIGNSGNKMIDLVDQILYKKKIPNANDAQVGDQMGTRSAKLVQKTDSQSGLSKDRVNGENLKLRQVSMHLNEIAATANQTEMRIADTNETQKNLYYNQTKQTGSKASLGRSGPAVKLKRGASENQNEYQVGAMTTMAAGHHKLEASLSAQKPPRGAQVRGMSRRDSSQQSLKSDRNSRHGLLAGERTSKTVKKASSKKLLLTSQDNVPHMQLNGQQMAASDQRLRTEEDVPDNKGESPGKTYEDQRYERYKKAERERRKHQYDRLLVMQAGKVSNADGSQASSQLGKAAPGLRLSHATSQSSMSKRERSHKEEKKSRRSRGRDDIQIGGSIQASSRRQLEGEPSVTDSSDTGSSSDSFSSEEDGSQDYDGSTNGPASRLQMQYDPIFVQHHIMQQQQAMQQTQMEALAREGNLAQAQQPIRDIMAKRQSEPTVQAVGNSTMQHVPAMLIQNPALVLKQQLAANQQLTSKSPPPSFIRPSAENLAAPQVPKPPPQPMYLLDNSQNIIQQRFAGKANSYKQGALFSQALANHQYRIRQASDQAQIQGDGVASISRRLQAADGDSPRRLRDLNGQNGTQAPRNKGAVISPDKVKFYNNSSQNRDMEAVQEQESRPPRHNIPPQNRSHRKKTHLKIQNIIMSQNNQQYQQSQEREQRQFASLEKRRTGEQNDMRLQRAEIARKKSYNHYASQHDTNELSRNPNSTMNRDDRNFEVDHARRFRKDSQANKSFGQHDRLSGNLSVGQAVNDPRSSDTFVQYSSHETGLFQNQRLQELASSTNRDQNGHEASASSLSNVGGLTRSQINYGNTTQNMNMGYMHGGQTTSDMNRAVFQTTGHTLPGFQQESPSEHSGKRMGGSNTNHAGTTNTTHYSSDQYNYKSVNYNNTVKFPEIKQSNHQMQQNQNVMRKPPHPQNSKIRRELNGNNGQRLSEDLGVQGLNGRSFKNTSRMRGHDMEDRNTNRDLAQQEYHGSKMEEGRTQRSINGSFHDSNMSQGGMKQMPSNLRFMRSPQNKKNPPQMTSMIGEAVRASGTSTNSLTTTPQRQFSNNKYNNTNISVPKTIQQDKTSKLTMSPHGNQVIFGNQAHLSDQKRR